MIAFCREGSNIQIMAVPLIATTNTPQIFRDETVFPQGTGVNGEVSGVEHSAVCLSKIEGSCNRCDFCKECAIKLQGTERV